MRLVVIGARGRTGRRVVDEGLARGGDVLAVVRAAGPGDARARVAVAEGDARDDAFLRRVLRADDVVVSALGATRDEPDGGAVSRGTAALVAAMEEVGARRLLCVVGAGVLLSEDGVPRHALPDYPARFRPIGREHQAALDACARSSLSWIVVGCPRIVDADATGLLRARVDHLPPGTGQVTTGDLAALLVGEALAPAHARVRLGVNQAG